MPRINLSQWVAYVNGSVAFQGSDGEIFQTAAFMFAHVLPRGDLSGVPKRGNSLIATSKSDTERAKELAVGTHPSQLTARSTKVVGVTHLENTHQIARGFANVRTILLAGLADSEEEGTLGKELYRAAAFAADADTVREAKEHCVAHPALLHSINNSVTR